jgi:hypothetical protein
MVPILAYQKSQFRYILEGLGMKFFGIFRDHSVHSVFIWYMLWPFGIFCCRFGVFYAFWYLAPRKIWQPWSKVVFECKLFRKRCS